MPVVLVSFLWLAELLKRREALSGIMSLELSVRGFVALGQRWHETTQQEDVAQDAGSPHGGNKEETRS